MDIEASGAVRLALRLATVVGDAFEENRSLWFVYFYGPPIFNLVRPEVDVGIRS
jgi:hypothetical protein